MEEKSFYEYDYIILYEAHVMTDENVVAFQLMAENKKKSNQKILAMTATHSFTKFNQE